MGNLYVEAGRFGEAMEVFSRISRQQQRMRQRQQQQSESDHLLQNHARPEEENVDTTSAFAARTAERFGSVGGNWTRLTAAPA